MDGIQPYPSGYPSQARQALLPTHAAPDPSAVKAPSDYVKAVRRRVWLVFMIGVPLSILAAIWVVRQPAIYQAKATILVEPPRYDAMLGSLLSQETARPDPEVNDHYLHNKVAYLKSKALAQKVVNDPAFLQDDLPPEVDAAEEFLEHLSPKIQLNSNYVTVTLEGTDPARTAKQLQMLLAKFAEDAKVESGEHIDNVKQYANSNLKKLEDELRKVDQELGGMMVNTKSIGPRGDNIIQGQYEIAGSIVLQKKLRLDDFRKQAWTSQLFPKLDHNLRPEDGARLDLIRKYQEARHALVEKLDRTKRVTRGYINDPSYKDLSQRIANLDAQMQRLQETVPRETALDPTETIVSAMQEDIQAAEETAKALLEQLRVSMPDHQKFLSAQDDREVLLKRVGEMKTKISGFDALSQAQAQQPPVRIPTAVTEPTVPVRPRRTLNILGALVVSFGLGIALVCLLEYLDHSVKVPEHLSIGLMLPLLGVVPRIRRTSKTQRGGHLWTTAAPDSVEADAYRNLRASLLGSADRHGPITTLLVTSAKAGEGKSTTALNLAATCARAGERTLLVDVDLRRPSLREVFHDDDHDPDLGLVDVLRGDLPWQRTVIRTDLPNLDFLPTGDTREIPIEILGTLELRQLLIGLANHYDRVILDGPAVLGLADCRMLGRVVDSALLVVRSGAHGMRPLLRAKAMLEQSHVLIAGLVFNGLYEDLQNWSSYGSDQVEDVFVSSRARSASGGLEAPETHAALPLMGGVE